MALSATAVKQAKPKEKQYKLFDGEGLFLLVTPTGGKWWRLKYRFAGKEKLLSLGTYPDVSLLEARDERTRLRKQIRKGIDPSLIRKTHKAYQAELSENSFEIIAKEWFAKFSPKWSEGHISRIESRLKNDIYPYIGSRPISEISPPELLALIRRVENRGVIETAHRVKQVCGQIFRYAVATGRAERDPSQDLKGALPPRNRKNFPSPKRPDDVARLLNAIDGYQGTTETRAALKLLPLVFVRPGELRRAEWFEIDFKAREWHIPAEKMKMGEKHIVPLSNQAMAILEELFLLTGKRQYLFPSVRTRSRPMSENTINAALRRLGYTKDEITAHGFRSIASTLLNEQGWDRDWIERQLAHAERDNVRAAYNYAQYLPQRKEMMQAWADYLEKLRIQIRR